MIELRANVVGQERHLGKALGSDRSLRMLSRDLIAPLDAGNFANTAPITGGDHPLHPHDWMGGARRGARLYFRCRARTAPFTSAAGACSSNTAGDFGDLCHKRSIQRRGQLVALVRWTREPHCWRLPLQQGAHGTGRCVHALPYGLVRRRLARRHMGGPRMDVQPLCNGVGLVR